MLPADLSQLLAAVRRLHPFTEVQGTGRGVSLFPRHLPNHAVELIAHNGGYPMQVRGDDTRLTCTVYNAPEAILVLCKHLDDFASAIGGVAPVAPLVPTFTHHVIGHLVNAVEGRAQNTFLRVGDIDGDSWPDIVVGGRNGGLAWWRNPGAITDGWTQHVIDPFVENRDQGGSLVRVSGVAGLDLIIGGDEKSDALSWWQNPGAGARKTVKPWRRRTITETGYRQFSDALIGDVTGGLGELSLVYLNQRAHTDKGAVLARIPLPADPMQEPWPGGETIAWRLCVDDVPETGLLIADIDGDGQNEIVAGGSWYKWTEGGWQAHRYLDPALGYITTVLGCGDMNGDGQIEIVVSEGSRSLYHGADAGGRLAWFSPDDGLTRLWTEHLLADNLRDARALQVGDICGRGSKDILIGEAGIRSRPDPKPRLMLWQNVGEGDFLPHLIDEGIGAQLAVLCDLEGRGKPDIVTVPAHGPDKWRIHVWRQND